MRTFKDTECSNKNKRLDDSENHEDLEVFFQKDNPEEDNLMEDLFDEMTASDRAAIMKNMDTAGIDEDWKATTSRPNEQRSAMPVVSKPDEMNDEDMMMFSNITVLPLANTGMSPGPLAF